ncbi:hypothetical protein [Sphingomonas kyeonggiensis]|uniref:Uncharacterized protein n=1 Tax=Sphingomonas kyeonggiensis TaxID=1268553 RepID=A0A7W6JNX2_9SPHN|nr:hypothetical protein [Sphingomonas kyeonggiensis]MBB4096858.1 hypothetical protein [Sphingomonas kyeonggiensis]
MFWTIGLAIALANLPMAGAELKCGFATLQQGDFEMTVAAVQQDALPASVTRVQLQSFDAGHGFALGAVYSPEGMALGPPTELFATSLVALASDAQGPVEQLLAFPEGAAKEDGSPAGSSIAARRRQPLPAPRSRWAGPAPRSSIMPIGAVPIESSGGTGMASFSARASCAFRPTP